ncbi:MAG: glycosyltransferase family 4 protein [Pseudomonadales bacterium]|nr:glycosyltransferase family 4 protein [Pseudomonadales bacterium]
MNEILFITEDFPSGLNGTSVKTRNTLEVLLKKGYKIDVCCFHFEEFKVHNFKHKNLKIFTVKNKRQNKLSLAFYKKIAHIIFSVVPATIRRLFNHDLEMLLADLLTRKSYSNVIFDGYSTLQYLNKNIDVHKIYIDDEDFTSLFWQRFISETSYLKKLFYFHEYIKSFIYDYFYMRKVDQIWAISPKTELRLKKASNVTTSLMPTVMPLNKYIYSNKGHRIVFTGTLNWKENVDGIKWFIDSHWANVLKFVPDAKLVIIGQGATKELISYFNNNKNIIYKGYVKDLEKEYGQATISIAPVRINAGIKVKILTYISYGLPVVSTEKASWGLVSTDGLLVSFDNNFARCIIILLRNKKLRKILSKNAYKNIKQNYSQKLLENFLFQKLTYHE